MNLDELLKGPSACYEAVMAAAKRDVAQIEELLRLGLQIEQPAWEMLKQCLALAWFDGYGQAREDLAEIGRQTAVEVERES